MAAYSTQRPQGALCPAKNIILTDLYEYNIAEENGVDTKNVVVRNFREVQKTSLEQFIADNGISYHKYQLGE